MEALQWKLCVLAAKIIYTMQPSIDFMPYLQLYCILGYFWGTKFYGFPQNWTFAKIFLQMTHMDKKKDKVWQNSCRINFHDKLKVCEIRESLVPRK